MEKLWFNEDDDIVYGYKNCFDSEEEFVKAVYNLHKEQTGFGCIVHEVKCNAFIFTSKTLESECSYLLTDSGTEIAVIYHAECESLEN